MEVTGVVKNKKTNETIVGAAVFKSDANAKPIGNGVLSDINGKYRIPRMSNGDYITASIVGMKPLTQKVTQDKLDFLMEDSESSTLTPVEIVADRPVNNNSTQPTKNSNKTKWIFAAVGLVVLSISILVIRKIAKS